MHMITEMTMVARECVRRPRHPSIYSTELDRFVCPGDDGYNKALEERKQARGRSTIEPAFKLVFLTAAVGTLICLGFCVLLTLLGLKEAPGLLDRVVTGLLDLVKIGFGAVIGLLGGQVLHGRD
jgi:hypothetical protein